MSQTIDGPKFTTEPDRSDTTFLGIVLIKRLRAFAPAPRHHHAYMNLVQQFIDEHDR